MNFSLTNLKNLEINHLTHLDNYLPDYQTTVKHIIIISSIIFCFLLIIGISSIIVTAVLSQPLFLLGFLIAICLLVPTIILTSYFLKKYFSLSSNIKNISLDAVKNFSIKEKSTHSLTLKVHLNNNLSKEIVFVSQPFSQVLKNLPHSQANVPENYPRTAYVCPVDKNGLNLYPCENKHCLRELQSAHSKSKKNAPFLVGQTSSAIIFTGNPFSYTPSSLHSSGNENQENEFHVPANTLLPNQPNFQIRSIVHSYLFLTYPNQAVSSLASFCEELKITYKNLFLATEENKIKELHLPLLGINPRVLEGQKILTYKHTFSSKILLQSLFEEIIKSTSLEKIVVFIDKNSIIEKLICSKLAAN